MARLIDADALMYSIRHAIYPSDMTTTVAIGICESHLEDAPTVEAIPVEWLKGIRDIMRRSSSPAAGDMLNRVIEMWHKEQEAR